MNNPMPQETRLFLEKLIEEKRFESLSPELKEDIIGSLSKRLEAFIITAITGTLDAEKAEKMNALFDSGKEYSPEELQNFLKENVPNIEEVVAKAMLEFRSVYLNS
jgi:hypothetical protein